MPTITATQIKNENNWTDEDITDTNLEYLIDNIINYVNLIAGTSISNLSGTAGTKSVTVTSSQDFVIKSGVALAMRSYLDKGPNVAMSGISISEIVTDPHYRFLSKMFNNGINMLRSRSIARV